MKKVIGLILVLIMVLSAVPALAKSDDGQLSDTVAWRYYDGTLTVSGTGEIPDVPDGGYPAWEGYRQDIKKVIIGEGITSIGRNVFQYWIKGVSMHGYSSTLDADVKFIKNAEFEVTLPDSLKEIKYSAFFNRYGLKSITLPKGIEKIESSVFSSTGLTDVYYKGTEEEWENVIVEDDKILSGDVTIHFEKQNYENSVLDETDDFAYIVENGKAYVTDYTADSSEVVIPYEIDGYTVVGIVEAAFANRDDITKVTIPDTVTTIEGRAFSGCSNIEEIVLPDSVRSIHEYTFTGCVIKKLVLGKGISYISANGFSGCKIERMVVLNPATEMHDTYQYEAITHGRVLEYTMPGSFMYSSIGEIAAHTGSIAEKYAKEMNIKFVPLEECEKDTSIEVEPKIQGIHGGIIDRLYLADRITKIAENMGGTVTISGDNIAVQKDGKSMAIVGDTAYYMENGKMVTESIFENAYYVKIPEKALESVLGEDSRMSEKYKEFFRTYNGEIYRIEGTVETGDVKPLEEKVEEKPAEEKTEPAKTIEHDGMKVSVSILSEPQNGPENLFDKNLISYCVLYVKDEKAPEYMEFDLGEIKGVEKLALAFRDAKTRTTYFDVRVSEDGINYETVIPKRGSNADTNELQYFDINKKARYVRVYGYSNTYNKYWVSITEARVITQ